MKPLLLLLAVVLALAALPSSLAAFTSTSVNGQAVTSHPDWTPPTVTLTLPTGPLRGNVATQATATDARSAVGSIEVQLRAVGSTTWVTRCTLPAAGGSCVVPTSVHTDGTYELRAIAVDAHDNVGTSTVETRVFDNAPPAVTLADPGALLSGIVTLTATSTDATSGVASVRFQISPAGNNTWTELCTVTTAPFSCALDTTKLGSGAYDLRAVGTDRAGNSTTSAIVANRRIDNSPMAVTLVNVPEYVRGTVTLTAQVVASGTSTVTVVVERRVAGTNNWTTVCTTSTAPYTCAWHTTAVADGDWELRARASSSTASGTSTAVDTVVDNAPPVVTMQDPGTPLSGTVTLSAAATDVAAHTTSGIAAVRIQVAPQGGTSWVDVCEDTTAPYTCAFGTTSRPDGLYAFRAIAVDRAGNSTTSSTIGNRAIDNTVAAVAITDPGDTLRGTVTLEATASSTAGVASVRIEARPTGATTWQLLCTDTTAPYSCEWDTRTVRDGSYELRAVLLDGVGGSYVSTTVTGRIVDNAPVRGVDVQAYNVAGGIQGRLETGDRIEYSYSQPMRPSSIVAGWDGTARQVVLRLRHRNAFTDTTRGSGIDVFTTTGYTVPVNLGLVRTNQDHLGNNQSVAFHATLRHELVSVDGEERSVVIVTLGAIAQGQTQWLRTAAAARMEWTPSVLATDVDGIATVGTTVLESGPLDRDL